MTHHVVFMEKLLDLCFFLLRPKVQNLCLESLTGVLVSWLIFLVLLVVVVAAVVVGSSLNGFKSSG